jgi:hypothetical protein
MSEKGLLVSFILLIAAMPISAAEITINLNENPTQQEFVLAAKKALYSRNYELRSVDPDVVIGMYRGKIEMALILIDRTVIVRNTDNGGANSTTISKYLRNLRRDFTYELADYALMPMAKSDPAKARALVEKERARVESTRMFMDYDLAGIYEANISENHSSPDFRNLSFKVRILQEGKQITGIFGQSGKIWGEIKDGTIKFDWFAAGGWSGGGNWEIDSKSNDLKGTWSHGEWNMSKIE